MSESDRFLLKQILVQEKKQNAPRAPESAFFEQFAAEQILKDLDYDLDPEQLNSGSVGGSDDGGVDSFYVFANRRLVREDNDIGDFKDQQVALELVIIQAKNSNGFSEAAIQKLTDFTDNCLALTARAAAIKNKIYSQALIGAVQRFHGLYKAVLVKRPSLAISFHVATLGEGVHPKVQVRADLLAKKCKEHFSVADVSVDFVGAKRLLNLYNQEPTKTLTLQTSKNIGLSAFGTSYICLVPLRKFYDFISHNGVLRGHIFEANVRDYQGDVAVNEQIAQTLDGPQTEEFWWLNNGITVIASDVEGGGEIISVTDPLIVNGLQTSHEIYNHFKKVPHTGDDRTILVRIVEINDPQSVDRIIKATNSQTKIPKIWLHATEDIHRKIEIALQGVDLYYDRRKNHYRRKGVPAAKIVTLPYLAQAIAAIVLQRPDDARARPTSVADQHYTQMFSEAFPIELYPKCALILKKVDDFLDGVELPRSEKNNLMFHIAMYAAGLALSEIRPTMKQIAALDPSHVDDDLLTDCFKDIGNLYIKLDGNDRVAKGSEFVEKAKRMLAGAISQ